MKTGIELIIKEREEQITKHSRTVRYDVDLNNVGQLRDAALALLESYIDKKDEYYLMYSQPIGWDKDIWFKMCKKPYKERLIIAGALIVAEIDRLQFISESNQSK